MTITVLPVRKERVRHRPYLLLALFQVADVLTTGFILNAWTARAEGNPIAAFILHHRGLLPGLTLLLALKLAMVWVFYVCQTGVRLASALYSLVIANNLLFILLWFMN